MLQWHKSRKEWSAPSPGAIRTRGLFSPRAGGESPAQGDKGKEEDAGFLGGIFLPWAELITSHANPWAGGATGTLEQLASTSLWEDATSCRPVALGKITHQSLMESHRRCSYYVGVDAKEQLSRGLWFIFDFVKYICLPHDPLILPLPAHVNREPVNGTLRSQQAEPQHRAAADHRACWGCLTDPPACHGHIFLFLTPQGKVNKSLQGNPTGTFQPVLLILAEGSVHSSQTTTRLAAEENLWTQNPFLGRIMFHSWKVYWQIYKGSQTKFTSL